MSVITEKQIIEILKENDIDYLVESYKMNKTLSKPEIRQVCNAVIDKVKKKTTEDGASRFCRTTGCNSPSFSEN